MKTTAARIVGPRDGKAGFLGSIGVRFMIDGDEAARRFSLVEHPMSARALAAPLHRHTREDDPGEPITATRPPTMGPELIAWP